LVEEDVKENELGSGDSGNRQRFKGVFLQKGVWK
jgi:hypothetical protein